MTTLRHHIIDKENSLTVRDILTQHFHISFSLRKQLTRRTGAIRLNGRGVTVSYSVHSGDLLEVDITDPAPQNPVHPVDYPLDILWEDEYLLALNKPAGIVVHGAELTEETVTIAGAVAHYLGNQSFHGVNRLDRGTTGVMLVAKSGYLHARCMELLQSGGLSREYRAVCEGILSPASGTIDLPIGRDESSLLRRCVREDGAKAITEYEVLETASKRSLLRLLPRTGRTHQLRVHMAAIGHPLVGDWLYGTEDHSLITRPALHSYILRFIHPVTEEKIFVTAPLPEDLRRLMNSPAE